MTRTRPGRLLLALLALMAAATALIVVLRGQRSGRATASVQDGGLDHARLGEASIEDPDPRYGISLPIDTEIDEQWTQDPNPWVRLPPELHLPVAPANHRPWSAPAGVPRGLVPATEEVFRQNVIPDPRGCPWREVEIVTTEWGTGAPSRERISAWVIPDGSDSVAFSSDGVFRRIARVVGASDIRRAVDVPSVYEWWVALDFTGDHSAAAAVFLVRAGEPLLALQVAREHERQAAFFFGMAGAQNVTPSITDGALYGDYLANITLTTLETGERDEAIAAYRRGDYAWAAVSGLLAYSARHASSADEKDRMIDGARPSIPLRNVVGEAARRLQHPAPGRRDIASLPPAARRHALLARLEDATMTTPDRACDLGLPFQEDDPVVIDVVAEGTAIVPGLRDVIERDRRYTRALRLVRERGRCTLGPFARTADVAVRALELILRHTAEGTVPR